MRVALYRGWAVVRKDVILRLAVLRTEGMMLRPQRVATCVCVCVCVCVCAGLGGGGGVAAV